MQCVESAAAAKLTEQHEIPGLGILCNKRQKLALFTYIEFADEQGINFIGK